jgi:hypothetical protein
MKTLVLAALVAALSTSALAGPRPGRRAAAPAAPTAQTLPIRRVTIYSNGVAYVERRGIVTGRAEIALPFKQSQVDDALKSMVVLDLGQGRIGAVSYASSEPPAARLAEIPLSIDPVTSGGGTLGGVAGVLRQLQGARVVVALAKGRTVTGAILTVEQQTAQPDASKPPVTTRTLVLATDAGDMESFDLAAVRSIRLVDENARRNVAEFADASAAARRQDANTIVVTSDGAGPREMVVGYTIAAPIWKTTYRVVLDDSGKPFFQGWAIVDNVSEEDWKDVSLSLVSGTPVSFIQRLQQPYYRHRPVVPIPGDVQLTPQGHEPASDVAQEPPVSGKQVDDLPLNGRNPLTMTNLPPGAANNAQLDGADNNVAINAQSAANAHAVRRHHASLATATLGEATGVVAETSGEEVGDLFEYRVEHPVSLDRNRSALIPIVQTRLEGARVSVYNAGARPERPFGGMRLKNSSALVLESGPVAVFDGDSYVGDAILDRIKPGEERFLTFALDLGTLVTTREESGNGPVFLVRAADGAIDAQYFEYEKRTYTLKNQTDRPRVVYVEHPRRKNWDLAEGTPEPAQRTANLYRFRVVLEPRAVATLSVSERSECHDAFALSELTRDEVTMLYSRRYIDDASRVALDRIVDIRTRLSAIDSELERHEEEAEKIGEDQSRLRENIEALNKTAEAKGLIARYVAKADAQETRLEQIDAARRAAEQERTSLHAELAAAVRGFTIDRRISADR